MALAPQLLEIIVCPQCRGALELTDEPNGTQSLTSDCGLVFGIQDDIPVLLVDEARKV